MNIFQSGNPAFGQWIDVDRLWKNNLVQPPSNSSNGCMMLRHMYQSESNKNKILQYFSVYTSVVNMSAALFDSSTFLGSNTWSEWNHQIMQNMIAWSSTMESVKSRNHTVPYFGTNPIWGLFEKKLLSPNGKVFRTTPIYKVIHTQIDPKSSHALSFGNFTVAMYWNQQGGLRWSTADIQISSMIFMIYIICHISYHDTLW